MDQHGPEHLEPYPPRDEESFAQERAAPAAVWAPDRTRPLVVTLGLIAVNCLVMILVLVLDSGADIVESGANNGARTTDGEWWRLGTSMFLHAGLIHIGFNMYILWQVGSILERLYGRAAFGVLYALSGIAGGVTSLHWDVGRSSIGASGAVLGTIGGLAALLITQRAVMPPEAQTQLRKNLLVFLGLNLLFGMLVPFIDMAAHMGGLVAGLACGLLLPVSPDGVPPPGRGRRIALTAAAGALATVAATLPLRGESVVLAELQHFDKEHGKVLRVFDALTESSTSDAEFADGIERDILPPWRALRDRVAAVGPLRGRRLRQWELLQTYIDLREQTWVLWVEAKRKSDEAIQERAHRSGYAADDAYMKFEASRP